MKILHLIDSGGLYGAEKMLLALVSEQLKQGLEPTILSAGAPDIEQKALEAEARRLNLPVIPWRMKPGLNLKEAKRIIAWAKKQGFNVIHSHGYKFNILIGIWPQRMRLPVITTLHGYVRAPRFSRIWLYEMLDRMVLPRMDAIVLVDEQMKAVLGLMQDSERVYTISNGVDIAAIEQQAEDEPSPEISHFLQTNSPVILGVGRLSREKAFEQLVEAFSAFSHRYPDSGLLIVGEGNCRPALDALISYHDLQDKVLMPGFCGNVPALMARASVLVIPSMTEGLPITLLEAMALGLPVVASAVGAIPTALDDGEGGWLVRAAGAENFTRCLFECAGEGNETQQKVGQARQKLNEAYSSCAMAISYRDIYQRVAS